MGITFRYSAIDTAHRCLKKYQRQYLLGETVEGLDSIDTTFGTAMHTAIQANLEGDDAVQTFNMYWASVKDKEFVPTRLGWDALKNIGEVFVSRFDRLHKGRFKIFKMEEEIKVTLGPYAFSGTPDFIGWYNGVPSIVDFKTSGWAYPKEKILSNEQMFLYAAMVKAVYGFEVEQIVYYVFVKGEQRIQVMTLPLTAELLKDRMDNIMLMCKDLTTRTEYPKNPSACVMGPYRCPYFDKCFGGNSDET